MTKLTPIQQAAERLRIAAHNLDCLQVDLTMPVQEIGIKAAAERIRSVLGASAYFAITLPEVIFPADQPGAVGPWAIYSNGARFEANSLADALNLFLASHRPSCETVEKVDEALAAIQQPF